MSSGKIRNGREVLHLETEEVFFRLPQSKRNRGKICASRDGLHIDTSLHVSNHYSFENQSNSPAEKENKIILYAYNNNIYAKTTDYDYNITSPFTPQGPLHSIQFKDSNNSINGSQGLLYNPESQTLLFNNIAPADPFYGLNFQMFEQRESLVQDYHQTLRSVFSIRFEKDSEQYICSMGDEAIDVIFDIKGSDINNARSIKLDSVGYSKYFETSQSAHIYTSAVSTSLAQSEPFTKNGNIIFQARESAGIVFATKSIHTGDGYRRTLHVKPNTIEMNLGTQEEPSFCTFTKDNSSQTKSIVIKGGESVNGGSRTPSSSWSIVHTEDDNLEFRHSNGWTGILRSNVNSGYNTYSYVGRLLCAPYSGTEILSSYSGYVVISAGTYNNEDTDQFSPVPPNHVSLPTYGDATPTISVSTTYKDSKVLGVIEFVENTDNLRRQYYWGAFGTALDGVFPRTVVATVGVAVVWVIHNTNMGMNTEHKNIVPGDLLTTSNVFGYATIQYDEENNKKDDIIRSYTLGKVTGTGFNFDTIESGSDYETKTIITNGISHTAVLMGIVLCK